MRSLLGEALGQILTTIHPKVINLAIYAIEHRIAKELAEWNEFRWRGLGTFKVKTRKVRSGPNIHTGEHEEQTEVMVITFKTSRKLRDLVLMLKEEIKKGERKKPKIDKPCTYDKNSIRAYE